MNYISTRELARKWDVSISLIVRLAKTGRIPGARLVGKSWMFPEGSEKPTDKRKKAQTAVNSQTTFRFPFYLFSPYSDEEINSTFSEEEQALYNAELLFYQGDYSAAAADLEKLHSGQCSRDVRYGVLYYLCVTNIYLHNYTESCRYYHEIRVLFARETEHLHELELILYDLETYFAGNEQYLDRKRSFSPNAFPSNMQGYLLLNCAYTDLLHALLNNERINPAPYQLICDYSLEEYSTLCQIFLLMYTALLLQSQQNIQESRHYILRSCLLAQECRMEDAIVFVFDYFPELFGEALTDTHPELLGRLNRLAGQYRQAFHGLLNHLEKTEVFRLLSPTDYQFIAFAKDGATHKEIAAALHLSPATISKKFAALYEKTGTHNKSELLKLCSDAFKTY